ncbi:MAG TPA: patatin-like phospholipase family protein [Bacilli bacterium]|nr:patatin-like phospholipase family protein [Bacilli bacterium]
MKVGLVLGGGGALGSYQLGVLKALMEKDVHKEINYVSGTSIGAINALLLMSDMTFSEMETLWTSIDNKKLYGDGLGRYKHDLKGLFSISELYDLLLENRSITEIQKSHINGYATLVHVPDDKVLSQINRRKMKLEIVHLNTAEDPYKVALASASIPLLFGPTEIDGEYYVDGGVIDNLPIQALLDQGCDLIITVSLFAFTKVRKFKGKVSLIDITPKHALGIPPLSIINFSPRAIVKNIELGYKNAREVLNYLDESGYADFITERQTKKPLYLNLKLVQKKAKRLAKKKAKQARREQS